MALRVDDLDAARAAPLAVGVSVPSGNHPGTLVLDPDDTAAVEGAVVHHLLPGDPRA
jgi:hypothetical protein